MSHSISDGTLERITSIVRQSRQDYQRAKNEPWSPWTAELYGRWLVARNIWVELGACMDLCDQCMKETADHHNVVVRELDLNTSGKVSLCDGCEEARRREAGLCTNVGHANPEPCTDKRKCDDCCEDDGLCMSCRRAGSVVSDVDEVCGECRADAVEHAYDAYRDREVA